MPSDSAEDSINWQDSTTHPHKVLSLCKELRIDQINKLYIDIINVHGQIKTLVVVKVCLVKHLLTIRELT